MQIKEDNWYMLILLLNSYDIDKEFEKFIKEENILGKKESIGNMSYDNLATSVQKFLENKELIILNEKQRQELLKFCHR